MNRLSFYFQISLRMGSLEILICVINIIITLEIDMGFQWVTKTLRAAIESVLFSTSLRVGIPVVWIVYQGGAFIL